MSSILSKRGRHQRRAARDDAARRTVAMLRDMRESFSEHLKSDDRIPPHVVCDGLSEIEAVAAQAVRR